jgi:hypothetical protein
MELPKVNSHPRVEMFTQSGHPDCCEEENGLKDRVARWFVLKPKIPIWEKFGGP